MKNGKRILFGLAALAAAWLFVSPASAQPGPKAPTAPAGQKMKQRAHKMLNRAKEACQSDIDKYCKDVKEGEGRIAACLKGRVDDLAPRCKIAYDRIDIQVQKRKIMKDMIEACKDDSEKLCKDVEAGKGGKIKCLKEHKAELSEACKAALPQRAKGASKPGKAEPKAETGGQEL
ncbi:MAG: cysteine rich repeat-containing protein [Elusimicrobia bacterium]|nr:cysteine rich repeat-containing protein [Elusimicrobiota bacterium]